MNKNPIALGVIGLGRAFTLMLPTFMQDQRIRLVAGTDPRASARQLLQDEFGARAHNSAEALCKNPEVELVYIASPHQYHMQHIRLAIAAGKHVLVEKPMAISLAECHQIVDLVEESKTTLIVGHSHSFNAPIRYASKLLQSGRYGPVGMINAINYTDFLYRPRRSDELNTALGGGVVLSQGAHQVDIVRLLAGGMVSTVQASTANWDAKRPTEGAYGALLRFENGAFATLTYSGYAHYDSDELMDNISEMGYDKSAAGYGVRRAALAHVASPDEEATLKQNSVFGGPNFSLQQFDVAPWHQHFGPLIVSAAGADIRLTASGLVIYDDTQRIVETLKTSSIPRVEVIDEVWAALRNGVAPLHDARWARATTEVCLAILESASTGQQQHLQFQVPTPASSVNNSP